MGHLITSVASLPLQSGGLGRFIDPPAQLLTDITSLEPTPLQLIAFGLLFGGVYALATLGLTMIFGVMDVINFVHSIFLVVGMYSVWLVFGTAGISSLLDILIAAAMLFASGVVVHVLIVESIIEAPQQNQLIVMPGVLFTTRSTIGIVFMSDPQQVELSLGSVQVDDVFVPLGQSYAPVIALGMILAVRASSNRTDLDRKIRGTVDNRDGARYVGISVRRINYLTFGIGATLAGVAGGPIALFQRFDSFTGKTYLINTFVIVVPGGLGSFPGAFVGGLIAGMIQALGGYYPPETTVQVLIFLLFIGMLLVKPEGLLGGAEA